MVKTNTESEIKIKLKQIVQIPTKEDAKDDENIMFIDEDDEERIFKT